MQFLYNEFAGKEHIEISGDDYRYLFKVRRFGVGKILDLRNMQDDLLYQYNISSIDKKIATLTLTKTISDLPSKRKILHLLWCIIDPKIIYQTLPMLNQIGVTKITFIYCDRSQNNFKIDLARAKKILINSSQQCGRSNLMELEIFSSLKEVIELYGEFNVMDFGGDREWQNLNQALIGCEGGFSDDEKILLKEHPKIGLKTTNILKSETATLSFCIKSLI